MIKQLPYLLWSAILLLAFSVPLRTQQPEAVTWYYGSPAIGSYCPGSITSPFAYLTPAGQALTCKSNVWTLVAGASGSPYVNSFTGTSVSVPASVHGQGSTPIVTVTDDDTPRNVVLCNIQIAANGDVTIGTVTSGTYNFWIR